MTLRKYIVGALLLAILLLQPLAAPAAEPARWTADDSSGELSFTAWYEDEAVSGRFQRFRVSVAVEASDRPPSGLEVEVDTGSADMNDREVNAELLESEWFDVANFPTATFRSSDIRASGGGYVAAGVLQIKGVERPLDLPLDWRVEDGAAQLWGNLKLSRRDWQVGTGEWSSDAALADRVEVRFRVNLTAPR
jgi:polyisoprenoid-binding protein YceI